MITPKQTFLASLPGGFLDSDKLKRLIELDRLCLVLVRCGCGRFLAPAQDVAHFCAIITRDGKDYVRDWSVNTADLQAACDAVTIERAREATRKLNADLAARYVPVAFREEDCGGVFDGSQVSSDADPGL